MQVSRGPRRPRASAHARASSKRRCRTLLLAAMLLAVGSIWLQVLGSTGPSRALPASFSSLETLWEAVHPGAACTDRLRWAGIDPAADPDSPAAARRRLHQAMNASLAGGLRLGGGAVQGRAVHDLFNRDSSGALKPILHPLDVPVRAVVMPLTDSGLARRLLAAVRRHLVPLFPPDALWLQDPDLMHSTLYHASTHLEPIPASVARVRREILAIIDVAEAACAVRAMLEAVVVTPAGTVVALWNTPSGAPGPEDLRRRLKDALPGASSKQVVTDAPLLHTTLARVALAAGEDGAAAAAAAPDALWAAAEAITRELCGLEAVMDALWFVEEQDLLALALGGRIRRRTVPLRQCTAGDAAVGKARESAAER